MGQTPPPFGNAGILRALISAVPPLLIWQIQLKKYSYEVDGASGRVIESDKLCKVFYYFDWTRIEPFIAQNWNKEKMPHDDAQIQIYVLQKIGVPCSLFNNFNACHGRRLYTIAYVHPPTTPRWETFFKTKLFIDFSFLLQMFDKECARGNAPCPSSPRAPPPSVTEGVAADKLKPSGSHQSTTSQPPA